MAARPHHRACFILGPFHPFRAAGLDVPPNGVLGAVDFEIGLNGDVDEVVLRPAQRGGDGPGNADDLEGAAVDEDFVADGVDVGKELVSDVLADHGGERAALIVAFGNIPAIGGRHNVDIHHVGSDTANVAVLQAV